VATLGLCEVLDSMGLSSAASQLESELGPYWEIPPEEAREAAQQAALQVRRAL
jgi:hypothetical protein